MKKKPAKKKPGPKPEKFKIKGSLADVLLLAAGKEPKGKVKWIGQ